MDSALKKDENCYLQVFLKECKHIEKKVVRYFIDDLEISSKMLLVLTILMKNKFKI